MVPSASATASEPIVYPYSDGAPLAESNEQLEWITLLFGNLRTLYRDRDDVFVGGDNFIYPVEGNPKIVTAPDVYIAYGRPMQRELKSYKVWEQGNIFPQVIVEVLSKSNSPSDLLEKRQFYEKYGCEEYLEIEPIRERLSVWLRGPRKRKLKPVVVGKEWVSPRMGIRFVQEKDRVRVYDPTGLEFVSHAEERTRTEAQQRRADLLERRADAAELEKERLRQMLRDHGLDPDTV